MFIQRKEPRILGRIHQRLREAYVDHFSILDNAAMSFVMASDLRIT